MVYWFLIVLILILIAILFRRSFLKKKKLTDIRDQWGKPKYFHRSFKLISYYLTAYGDENDISTATATDLDLEDIFSYIDRTNSKPGQQYLFKKLWSNEVSESYFTALEQIIERFSKDRHLRELTAFKLSELNNDDAYYLPQLFSKTHQPIFKPFIRFYIKISAMLILSLIIALVIIPNQIYLVLIFTLLITNFVIHIGNKTKMLTYAHSLPQVLFLNKVSTWLFNHDLLTKSDAVKQSLMNVGKLKKSLGFINIQNKITADPTDISYLVTEWLKMFLLIEPLNFIYSIDKINKYRDDIRVLFECVAEVDIAIAIQSVREGLPYYSKPNFNKESEDIVVKDLYHPLVENCVSNSISIDSNQGILITGSNMSGKTTFIRALAVNALLSQTINTSFATIYKAPPLKILTSININDDLSEHKSYFQAEASSIRNIIRSCTENKSLRSLVIIDEIFRGTNTIERIAAAKAVLSHLIENKTFVLVSTHDLELAELLGNDYKVFSFEELIGDNRLVFDYKIKEGLLKNKNGIAVLKGLDYPQNIIDEASMISIQLRNKYNL